MQDDAVAVTLTDKIKARLARRFPGVEPPAGERLVADGRVWVKVPRPRAWRPTEPGAVLIGELVSRSTRPTGDGGVYGVVTLRTDDGPVTVSGVVVSALFESAGAVAGTLVRIVYLGERTSQKFRTYRDFELYLARHGSEDDGPPPSGVAGDPPF